MEKDYPVVNFVGRFLMRKELSKMRIAVTYDNGEIFQHFGKTESFKIYEVEDNKVISSEIIGSNGAGHGALAGFLAEKQINVVICGMHCLSRA